MPNPISRRDLLKASALGAISATLPRPLGAIAGPFDIQDYRFLVPHDKKLDPSWVRSLTERGEPQWVSGDDLKYIGMPVGGLFAGTVYLGGDGKLWNWDIFNQRHEGGVARPGGVEFEGTKLRERDGANYVDPPIQQSPFELGVTLVSEKARPMDASGWKSVKFLGQYPVGTVEYSDPEEELSIVLEAFSPFVPHDVEGSSYPATVLRYTLKNNGDKSKSVSMNVKSEHPGLIFSGVPNGVRLIAERHAWAEAQLMNFTIVREQPPAKKREDLKFEDWESGSYGEWKATGTAFGPAPRRIDQIASYQGDLRAKGSFTVNTHETRSGENVTEADVHTGTLTSPEFMVTRHYINFLIGGGNHPGKTCLNLLVDGQVVRSATGTNDNTMQGSSFDVQEFAGKRARLQIVDEEKGGWGNIGIDEIVFSDSPAQAAETESLRDFGTFCAGFLSSSADVTGSLRVESDRPVMELLKPVTIAPGGTEVVDVFVSWHFPNLRLPGLDAKKRWYASRFSDARHVAIELSRHYAERRDLTFKWRDTWYDSTLPYWLLDRSFVNTSILATNTCHRFDDGRFWFWEGIGCCEGTCTHVWSYAQATARLFPEVESYLREHIDFAQFFHKDSGAIDYRAEFGRSVAHDGQLGCVMRAYREHTMQRNGAFLRRIWPQVKKAMQFIIAQDKNKDGLLEGAQYNTLDAAWYGEMSWLSSMYLAALRACEAMATEMNDSPSAAEYAAIIVKGSKNIVENLFDGEYFVHEPDPAHPEANATGEGCHIDQLYGQSWCHWMGLERVVPHEQSKIALANLYKYNFTPDVGPYRRGMKVVKGGRWYAVPGEGGLLMTTFPKGGAERATGKGRDEWAAMYFNECMSGFEYQAAAHMVAEGLLTEGLAVTRMIHDRYAPAKRNPYNEIECSDHYGRAMASFGVFWNVCGYRVHGPTGLFEAVPAIPGPFRAAFIDAHGWGTYDHEDRKRIYRYKSADERRIVPLHSDRNDADTSTAVS